MYPSIFQCTVLAALVGVALANIMAVSPDGSLVPWGLLPRAPGDGGLAVRLANYNDTAYLVSLFPYALFGVVDQITGNSCDG